MYIQNINLHAKCIGYESHYKIYIYIYIYIYIIIIREYGSKTHPLILRWIWISDGVLQNS